jgi:hypothetical protein
MNNFLIRNIIIELESTIVPKGWHVLCNIYYSDEDKRDPNKLCIPLSWHTYFLSKKDGWVDALSVVECHNGMFSSGEIFEDEEYARQIFSFAPKIIYDKLFGEVDISQKILHPEAKWVELKRIK